MGNVHPRRVEPQQCLSIQVVQCLPVVFSGNPGSAAQLQRGSLQLVDTNCGRVSRNLGDLAGVMNTLVAAERGVELREMLPCLVKGMNWIWDAEQPDEGRIEIYLHGTDQPDAPSCAGAENWLPGKDSNLQPCG